MQQITIIGAGRLAYSFTDALYRAGVSPCAVVSKTEEHAKELAALYSIPAASGNYTDIHPFTDIIILLVPDAEVRSVAEHIAQLRERWQGVTVLHCSGVLESTELEAFRTKGAQTASVQIVQSFPTLNPVPFTGVPAFIETEDNTAYTMLDELCSSLGLRTGRITGPEKKTIHAASVFVCNFLTGNLFAAGEITGKKGNEFISTFFPILKQTIINAETQGVENSLSGPALRGDAETVKRHLDELNNMPGNLSDELINSYKAQTEILFALLEQRGELTKAQINTLNLIRLY